MKREQRLRPIHDMAGQTERSFAARLGESERRVLEAEQRHLELLRYRQEYEQTFHARASDGAPMRTLREQQVFIARLSEAVHAQQLLLERLRSESAATRTQWREAATRKQVVGKVIEHARTEEAMRQDRQQQRDTDELSRAARSRR